MMKKNITISCPPRCINKMAIETRVAVTPKWSVRWDSLTRQLLLPSVAFWQSLSFVDEIFCPLPALVFRVFICEITEPNQCFCDLQRQ